MVPAYPVTMTTPPYYLTLTVSHVLHTISCGYRYYTEPGLMGQYIQNVGNQGPATWPQYYCSMHIHFVSPPPPPPFPYLPPPPLPYSPPSFSPYSLSLCFPVDDKWLSTGGSGDDCGVGYGGACSQFAWCQMVEEGLRCVCRPGFSGNGLECSGDHCVSESGRTPLPPLRVGPLHQYTDSRFILLYRAGTLMSLC